MNVKTVAEMSVDECIKEWKGTMFRFLALPSLGRTLEEVERMNELRDIILSDPDYEVKLASI